MDVNQYVAINIALLIDILIVTASAGVIASLSYAEWQRAQGRSLRVPQPASHSVSHLDSHSAANVQSESGGQSLTLLFFLISLSLFSIALFLGGWQGSIPMAEWSVILLAVLSALSITQTLFVAKHWLATRSAEQRNSINEGG